MSCGEVTDSFPFPTPHWPALLDPQARTCPSVVRNRLCALPVATCHTYIYNVELFNYMTAKHK